MHAARTTVSVGLAIEADGLVKRFGSTCAVNGLDLSVPQGTIYAALGPNGAGKTTTIRMLSTLLKPDAGQARVLGYDVVKEAAAVRSRVSLTGQFASLDEDLTGRENLVLIARLLGYSFRKARLRTMDLLEAFDLSEAASRQVKTYSGGMRRRLDIAASLVVTPELIFLDEPTTGLDPRSRNQVWDIVRALAESGATVLLTTQYMDEADRLADRIAVIDHGKVIAEGTAAELKASVGRGTFQLRLRRAADREKARRLLRAGLSGTWLRQTDADRICIQVDQPKKAAEAVAALSRSGIEVVQFSLGQPSLDEVFLALTGRPAAEAEAEGQGEGRS